MSKPVGVVMTGGVALCAEQMIVVRANALQTTAMKTRLTFDLNNLCVGFMEALVNCPFAYQQDELTNPSVFRVFFGALVQISLGGYVRLSCRSQKRNGSRSLSSDD
jgi:hypothetical protein